VDSDNGVGVMYVAPGGDWYDNGIDQIAVIYELTLGDVLIVILLAMILMTLIISAVLKALWEGDK